MGVVYLDNIRTGYTCGIGGSWGVVKLTLTYRTALIIKPRTPAITSKLPAEFRIPKQESDGPRVRLTNGPLKHTPIVTSTPPPGFPGVGCL